MAEIDGPNTIIPTSMFNAELTSFPDMTAQVLEDIASAGREPLVPADMVSRLSTPAQRQTIQDWYEGKSPDDLEPVLDRTRELAGGRISICVATIMQREQDLGRQLGLYSMGIDRAILEAAADGVEDAHGVEINILEGARYVLGDDERYTNEREALMKIEFLEELAADGHAFEIVADSFSYAAGALRKARKPILINPDSRIQKYQQARNWDVIFTRANLRNDVLMRRGGEVGFAEYNLRDDEGKAAFVEDLYYENDS